MRQDYWPLGTWGRIPVSLHWTALLSFAWLYILCMNVTDTLIGSVALLLLFAAHEAGHVFVLRRRRIPVTAISFFGLHGETSYNEYAAKAGDAVAVAWGGVAAQVVVLLLALAATAYVPFREIPFAPLVWGPMFFVFTKFNVFLMIIALLPIGPFDGHDAWRIIPRTRNALRRGKAAKRKVVPVPPPEPEADLTPEEQRELDASSQRVADDLLARLSRKSDAPSGER